MRKHIGPTLAFIAGTLFLIAGTQPGKISMMIAGLVMIIGSAAYRSAKKRGLGEVENRLGRRVGEAIAMVAIIGGIVLQKDLKVLIATDPVPNLLVPAWVVIAYLIATLKAKSQLLRAEEFKKCPYCAEQIKQAAVVCKYCGRDLPLSVSSSEINRDNLMSALGAAPGIDIDAAGLTVYPKGFITTGSVKRAKIAGKGDVHLYELWAKCQHSGVTQVSAFGGHLYS